MTPEYVDTAEAKELLQVADRRVFLLIAKREKLPHRRVGRVYLFLRSDVLDLAERRGGKVSPGRPKRVQSLA